MYMYMYIKHYQEIAYSFCLISNVLGWSLVKALQLNLMVHPLSLMIYWLCSHLSKKVLHYKKYVLLFLCLFSLFLNMYACVILLPFLSLFIPLSSSPPLSSTLSLSPLSLSPSLPLPLSLRVSKQEVMLRTG